MPYFFLSYKHEEVSKAFIAELQQRLNEDNRGLWLFVDEKNIAWSKGWRNEIDARIDDSVGIVVLLTHASLASHWVTYEWARGMGAKKRVLPVLLQPMSLDEVTVDGDRHPMAVHSQLSELQFPDFSNPDTRDWNRLIEELHSIAVETYVPASIIQLEAAINNPATQEIAIKHLFDSKHPAAREVLVRTMNDHAVEGVRDQIAFGLAGRGDRAPIARLIHIMRETNSYETRERAIRHLTDFRANEAVPAILELLSNTEGNRLMARSRSLGARALGEIGDPQSLPMLHETLRNDPYFEVKHSAAKAIGMLGTSADVPGLIDELIQHAKNHGGDPEGLGYVNALTTSIGLLGGKEELLHLAQRIMENPSENFEVFQHAGFEAIAAICSRHNNAELYRLALDFATNFRPRTSYAAHGHQTIQHKLRQELHKLERKDGTE